MGTGHNPKTQNPEIGMTRMLSLVHRICMIMFGVMFTVSISHADIIGDGLSSISSNEEFFSSMDTNLDGTVEESEIRDIVSSFGGGSLDEPDEIKRSVQNVLAQLDTNQDGTLTVAESRSFWHHLGALLSVNEVAAWVVHGIQMPESVGEIFRSNAVSGYDFAELIEDDGQALEELGITRLVHKKKLIRSIRMLLSGVGVTPSPPASPSVVGISCQSVKVSWEASDGSGFPIHKYIVYRHKIGNQQQKLDQKKKKKTVNVSSNIQSAEQPSNQAIDTHSHDYRNNWLLVYEGPSTQFIDSDLISGFKYEYQVEAWSLFGHSAMSSFSGGTWTIDESTSLPCTNQYLSSSLSALRENDSTLSSLTNQQRAVKKPLSVPLFPHGSPPPVVNAPKTTWEMIPWTASKHPYGYSHYPPSVLPRLGSPDLASQPEPTEPGNLRQFVVDGAYGVWWVVAVLWSPLMFLVTSLSPVFGLLTALMRIRRGSMNHKSDTADRVHGEFSWRLLALLASVVPGAAYMIPKSLRTDPKHYDVSIKNDGSASPAAVGTASVRNVKPPEMMHNERLREENSNGDSALNRCGSCHKRFHHLSLASLGGIVRMRPKHTCSSCWAVFCGACGQTNHSRLVTCPVAGGCLCKSCSSSVASTTTALSKMAIERPNADAAVAAAPRAKVNHYQAGLLQKDFESPPVPELKKPSSILHSRSREAIAALVRSSSLSSIDSNESRDRTSSTGERPILSRKSSKTFLFGKSK